jgi:hypothetical protein
MARRFVVDGSAVEAGQGVTGAECVVEAIRVLATGGTTDTVCCRSHEGGLPLRIWVARNAISLPGNRARTGWSNCR